MDLDRLFGDSKIFCDFPVGEPPEDPEGHLTLLGSQIARTKATKIGVLFEKRLEKKDPGFLSKSS